MFSAARLGFKLGRTITLLVIYGESLGGCGKGTAHRVSDIRFCRAP